MESLFDVFADIFDPNALSLYEVWIEKKKYADAAKMKAFVFEHEGHLYMSMYRSKKWTNPELVEKI